MMGQNPTNFMVNPQVAAQIQQVQQQPDDKNTSLASVSSTTQSPVMNRIQVGSNKLDICI